MIDEFDTDQVRPRARGGVRVTLTLTLPPNPNPSPTPKPTQDGEICVEEFSAIMKTTSLYD